LVGGCVGLTIKNGCFTTDGGKGLEPIIGAV